MMAWSTRRTWLAAIALVLLTNVVALIGVMRNHAGLPESELTFGARELQLPTDWPSGENSGLSFRLLWRSLGPSPDNSRGGIYFDDSHSPAWLDEAKLKALGFDTRALELLAYKRGRSSTTTREVLLVLELDGAARQEALQRIVKHVEQDLARIAAEAQTPASQKRIVELRAHVDREQFKSSRLFVVDAGTDLATLRATYADRKRYAIVQGRVRPTVTGTGEGRKVAGYIDALSIETINVPFAQRQILAAPASARRTTMQQLPLFQATVAYGQRLEPWLAGLSWTKE